MRGDPIRIMHLVASNFFGGPEKQVLNQARYLDSNLFELTVASFTDGQEESQFLKRAREQGLTVSAIRTKNAYDFTSIRRIRDLLIHDQVDILCTHTYRPNIVGHFAVRGTEVKQIAFSRGWTKDDLKVRFYHWLDRRFLPRIGQLVAVSEAKKRELLKLGIPEERIAVIPNAVKIPSWSDSDTPKLDLRGEYGVPCDCKLVASCGRLSAEKGHTIFVRMADIICNSYDNVRFLIVGEGPQKERLRLLGRRLIKSRMLTLTGFLPDFSRYLPQVDILVNASYLEGMPNIILEALSYARPVVATEVGGVGEVIEDHKTGLLVKPGDPGALAESVKELLQRPQLTRTLGEAGREFVARHHSFPAQAERLKELYLRVAGFGKKHLKGAETVPVAESQHR